MRGGVWESRLQLMTPSLCDSSEPKTALLGGHLSRLVSQLRARSVPPKDLCNPHLYPRRLSPGWQPIASLAVRTHDHQPLAGLHRSPFRPLRRLSPLLRSSCGSWCGCCSVHVHATPAKMKEQVQGTLYKVLNRVRVYSMSRMREHSVIVLVQREMESRRFR